MKIKKNLLLHSGTPIEDLPDDIRCQLEADPKLMQEFQEQANVASLIKLKSFEQPDPAMEGRVAHRVSVRIQNGEHLRKESKLDALPDWARMLAVVVFMLSLSVLTHREMLNNSDLETDVGLAEAETEVVFEEDLDMLTPLYAAEDPFAPTLLKVNTNQFPNLMTPELSRQFESSFIELGLDLANPQIDENTIPVSFVPFR
jgi:hypothetical protein